MTQDFLKLLDPSTNIFCFQTFPKASNTKDSAAIHYGSFLDLEEKLRHLNDLGHGISVCINETDGKGRKRENIQRIRAVWQDDDGNNKGDFPLEPSVVVETSPGRYHRYWLVEGDWPADEQGRLDFRKVMQCLVERYGGDKQATDISRVMRLPGFKHLKAEPTEVRITEANLKRYTRSELLEAFPSTEDEDGYRIDEKTGKIIEPQLPNPVEAPPLTPEPEVENIEEAEDYDVERIESALEHIPAEDREIWLSVGMSLHHAFEGGEEGFALWDKWSQKAPGEYKKRDQKRTWGSFREEHPEPRTIATVFHLAKEYGWKDPIVLQPLAQLPEARLNISRSDSDLVSRTMTTVREQFQRFEHNPSEAHYQGLERVAEVIQAMAEGDARLENNFYLSFLPPGIGKTTTLTCAVKSLIEIDRYKDVGVIIFLSRVAEIGRLVTEMKLEEQDYSVFVSKEFEEEKLGNPNKTGARVMFTTQQMLVSRLRRNRNFAEVEDFHWNDTPRQIRVWDESLSPAESITVNHYQIARLSDSASKESGPALADALLKLAAEIGQERDGGSIQIPDLRKLNGNSSDMRSWYETQSDKNNCDTLLRMSGKLVRIRKDRYNTVLDYETLLSDDLGPLLVLDASGQFRKVYEFWAGTQGNLFALPSPQKNYQGLTIHHWDRGAGLQARKDDGGELVDGIVGKINTIPKDESVLVIYHKQKSKQEPDWENAISERIDRKNIYFCNWGKHTATNDYQDCKHVILAGVLQYGASQYEAVARGAKRLQVEDDLSEDDLRSTHISEMAHNIFQAACRGRVRQAEGDQCPSGCHLYVIGSSHKKARVTPDLLQQIFPGAVVQEWTPIVRLTPQQQQLFRVLASAPAEIRKQALCEKLGIKHHQQVNALLNDPRIKAKLEAAGRKIELGWGTVTLTGAPIAPYDLEDSEWVVDYPF